MNSPSPSPKGLSLRGLAVFINTKSGGQQGLKLFEKIQAVLHPHDTLFDLSNGGPEPGLIEYRNKGGSFGIVVCGGDGSVGWVLGVLDKLKFDPFPPMAILPLGTGNDLSRTLGWGPGYTNENVRAIFDRIRTAQIIPLDRWLINMDCQEPFSDESNLPPKQILMNAYFGIGIDAEVALKFHNLRNEKPNLFQNRTMNKGIYSGLGFSSMIKAHVSLDKIVKLELDGAPFNIPKGVTGLIVLNLPSWGGGKNPWGTRASKKKWIPQKINDRKFELLGFFGVLHMGAIQANLQNGKRLAQASSITVVTEKPLPVQVDGEPWLMPPSICKVSHFNQAIMLYNDKYAKKMSKFSEPCGLDKRAFSLNIENLIPEDFDLKKLNMLREKFTGQKTISKSAFIAAVREDLNPSERENVATLADRIYECFDRDQKGEIDYDEFVIGMSLVTSASFEDKLKFGFSVFDKSKKGQISKQELTAMFETLMSILFKPSDARDEMVELYANVAFSVYDENNDGLLSFEEFIKAAKSDIRLAHLFTLGTLDNHIPPTPSISRSGSSPFLM